MKIRLAADIQPDSFLDGPGIRTVIWTQGCIHNCKGCHNPNTHSFTDGLEFEVDEIIKKIDNLSNQDGITFSGGDPMCQPEPCSFLAKHIKNIGLDVWCYTGYTFEQLLDLSLKNKHILEFLNNIDVLVDGKFIEEQRSLDLYFRGSKNQRVIDVKKSLKNGYAILIDEYMKPKKFLTEIEKDKYIFI